MELLRSVVDIKRRGKYGVGGTLDVLLGWFFIIAALVCGVFWLSNR
jgi:uncharacterized membrane protein YciS (DUF1049 family)